jgi:hypothetical protein
MSIDPSPRKPGAGGLQNFISVNSPYSDKTRSSRGAIKAELSGKLRFDDHSVFERLNIGRLSATLVEACVASFQYDTIIQIAKTELDKLLADASQKSEVELETEGVSTTESKGKISKVRERKMYSSLVCLLHHRDRDSKSLIACRVQFLNL